MSEDKPIQQQSDLHEYYQVPINCFRSSDGSIHLEYGNLMLLLSPGQFRILADAVIKAQRELDAESEQKGESQNTQ